MPAIFIYWKSPGHARFEAKYSSAGQDEIAAEAARTLNLRLVLTGPDVSVFRTL